MGTKVDLRLRKHPILEFRRGKPVSIYLNGKKIRAYEGETIAAALYASGIKVYSKSVKYGRPRGFFCGIGKCASCLMRVDGIPHIRTCIDLVKDGMNIEYEKGRGEPPSVSEIEAAHPGDNLVPNVVEALKQYAHLPDVAPISHEAQPSPITRMAAVPIKRMVIPRSLAASSILIASSRKLAFGVP